VDGGEDFYQLQHHVLVCRPKLGVVVLNFRHAWGSSHLNFWAVLGSETGTMPPKHEKNVWGSAWVNG
jgi:hypothetical protein